MTFLILDDEIYKIPRLKNDFTASKDSQQKNFQTTHVEYFGRWKMLEQVDDVGRTSRVSVLQETAGAFRAA